MSEINKLDRITKLRELLRECDRLYYDENDPQISDAEYDELKLELQQLESEYSSVDLFGDIPPSQNVGYAPSQKFKKIQHNSPMLSLDNAFNTEDVVEFDKRIKRFLNLPDADLKYTAELKIDGLSFCALYTNGYLTYVSTRGDGQVGEDVTQNAIEIQNFPRSLNISNAPGLLEVRGEIYMPKDALDQLNFEQEKLGKKPFANTRNAASGSLRVIDPSITRSRKLQYFAYNIARIESDALSPKSQSEALSLLETMGFNVSENAIRNASLEECLKFYDAMEKQRYNLNFDVDGIVYKLDDFSMQGRLGTTNKSPRWAIAHKFSGQYGISKILQVVNQVGRLGNITPVADLSPINIGGVVVKRATLHNYDEIKRLRAGIGDLVKITRAGDVVPRIVEVIERHSACHALPPENCPSCGTKLVKDDEFVALKCDNISSCTEQILQKIEHFGSKDALNIIGFGYKQVVRFYQLGMLQGITDIFKLKERKTELVALDRMGDKSVENLLSSIENAKNVQFSKLLYALSIRGIGLGIAGSIAKIFNNCENLLQCLKDSDATYEKLRNQDGIGDKIAKEFVTFFLNPAHLELLNELSALLNIQPHSDNIKRGKYSGMSIVFTGTMVQMNRQEAKNTAERLGFDVKSTISKNTDFLVCGTDAGSKLKQAKELNIKILSENEWLLLVQSEV